MKSPGIWLIVTGALLLLECSSERISGTKGGSETTNGIIATVFTGDGAPAAGSVVRIRRADYISSPDSSCKTTADCFDSVTDTNGRFMARGLEPASYHVEINDTVTGNHRGGAVLCSCIVGNTDTVDLGNRSLYPHAQVNGTIDRSDSGDDELIVCVRGLERTVPVTTDGSFSFDDLPAGKMDFVIENRAKKSRREVDNVATLPGNTIRVQVAAGAEWARYIYIDSLVAGIADSAFYKSFPLLVRLDAQTFDFSQARPEGEDIRFTKPDGTPLHYEIEQWDGDARLAALWVEVDTVYGGRTGQAIVMQWGDPEAESQSDGNAIFTFDSGYVVTLHGNILPDASKRIETAPGMIGNALWFDGTDNLMLPDSLNVSSDYTLSCWINAADLSTTRNVIWKEHSYALWFDPALGGMRVEHYTDSLTWRGIDRFSVPITADRWYYLVGTYDGGRVRLYVNGEIADSSEIITEGPSAGTQPLELGGRSGEFFAGLIDEVRIENVKHSAGWIKLCYLNQRQ